MWHHLVAWFHGLSGPQKAMVVTGGVGVPVLIWYVMKHKNSASVADAVGSLYPSGVAGTSGPSVSSPVSTGAPTGTPVDPAGPTNTTGTPTAVVTQNNPVQMPMTSTPNVSPQNPVNNTNQNVGYNVVAPPTNLASTSAINQSTDPSLKKLATTIQAQTQPAVVTNGAGIPSTMTASSNPNVAAYQNDALTQQRTAQAQAAQQAAQQASALAAQIAQQQAAQTAALKAAQQQAAIAQNLANQRAAAAQYAAQQAAQQASAARTSTQPGTTMASNPTAGYSQFAHTFHIGSM